MKPSVIVMSVLAAGIVLCCGGATAVENGGKTNWLDRCDTDSECGEGSCESGACAVACEHNDDCSGLERGASCAPETLVDTPGQDPCEAPPRTFCLPECQEDRDCSDIGSEYRCEDGVCAPTAPCGAEPSGPFPFCEDDTDCSAGESCFAGTCGADCTDSAQCASGERCLYEEPGCLLAVTDPSGQSPGGQCLPRCQIDADCEDVAPGLSCWAQGCVRALPECETRCPKIADGCPDGCDAITGRPYDPERMCRATLFETLGCVPQGRTVTSDDACAKSPEGLVYDGISGTYAGHLVIHGGYTDCSSDEVDAANAAEPCEQRPGPMAYPVLADGTADGTVCDPLQEIASSCAAAGCHAAESAADAGGLDLESPSIVDRLLGVPSQACPDLLLIDPDDFTQSYFYMTINKTMPMGCGDPMPSPFGYPAGYEANAVCLEIWVENVVNGFE